MGICLHYDEKTCVMVCRGYLDNLCSQQVVLRSGILAEQGMELGRPIHCPHSILSQAAPQLYTQEKVLMYWCREVVTHCFPPMFRYSFR